MKVFSVAKSARTAAVTGPTDEIWTYLAIHADPEIADRVVRSIRQVFDRVGRQPEIGSRIGDRSPGLRFVMAGKYVVMYEIEKRKPRIRRVMHGARDLSDFFGTENN